MVNELTVANILELIKYLECFIDQKCDCIGVVEDDKVIISDRSKYRMDAFTQEEYECKKALIHLYRLLEIEFDLKRHLLQEELK